MVAYTVDYTYEVEEFGTTVINADDPEQAEMFAKEYVVETFPEANNVIIDKVVEV